MGAGQSSMGDFRGNWRRPCPASHILGIECRSCRRGCRNPLSHDRIQGLCGYLQRPSLRVGRIKGHHKLGDFTDRRLLPAVRTCISFSARLEDLSQRLACTRSLLRTRVDTALSRQTRDLLAFLDRRTELQLRL